MTTNLFETQYDVTRKSKIKRFYESNKISIFSAILIIIIFLVGLSFYFDFKEKQRIEIKFLHLALITLQPLGVYLDLLKNMRDRVQT